MEGHELANPTDSLIAAKCHARGIASVCLFTIDPGDDIHRLWIEIRLDPWSDRAKGIAGLLPPIGRVVVPRTFAADVIPAGVA